jgi:predicted aminopeptidase
VRSFAVLVALALVGFAGCYTTAYVLQAADGELNLLTKAKPIEAVIADPTTPLWVATLLAELPAIKRYGASYGLHTIDNYTTYIALGRRQVVWFVGGADPVSFKATKYCFPIAGCFAGLGWYDEDDALADEKRLEATGLDAYARPATAYSTGGWFHDPLYSSMLSAGNDGFPYLANTVLHECVHATVFVPDEPFFNESFAEYIGDALTDHWVIERFGSGSPEDFAWHLGQAMYLAQTARKLATYKALDDVYKSDESRAHKLADKAKIIDALVDDLRLFKRPNNASLVELRVYHGSAAALQEAHRACGDLRRMVRAGTTLTRKDFTKDLQDDLEPIAKLLAARCAQMPA